MSKSNDIIIKNIQKQINLNSGQLRISNQNGTYSFVDSLTNTSISAANANNYMLSSTPPTLQNNLKADVYNYAKGVFGGTEVPDELVEALSSLATYYVSQTGTSVQSLFKNGVLQPQFLATINAFYSKTSVQFGYQSINVVQPWVNNPTLHGNMSAAFQQSLK